MKNLLCLLFLFSFSFLFADIKPAKIAILKIENRIQDYIDTELLTESLQIEIVNKRYFIVVERSMLGKILEEQKLSLSGLTEEEQATKIGALVGAEKIWIGSVSYTGDVYVITIKVIDTKTGIIEFADQVYSYEKGELFNLVPELAERLIKRAKGENVPKHEPKASKKVVQQSPSANSYQGNNMERNYYPVRPDTSIDLGFYTLSLSDEYSGYSGIIEFKVPADREGELYLDLRYYNFDLSGWALSGLNFNFGFNINLIANGYILLGGGIGFGIDFPNFTKNEYSISCFQLTLPLSIQFGFHLGRNFMIIFDASFVTGYGLFVSENNYSISEKGKFIKIDNEMQYIPYEIENALVKGINFTYLGGKISFLF